MEEITYLACPWCENANLSLGQTEDGTACFACEKCGRWAFAPGKVKGHELMTFLCGNEGS